MLFCNSRACFKENSGICATTLAGGWYSILPRGLREALLGLVGMLVLPTTLFLFSANLLVIAQFSGYGM